MSPNQKKVAAGLAVAALITALGFTVWLWATLSPTGVVVDPNSPSPVLRLNWQVALWLIALGTTAKTIFAILLTVLTVAVGTAGELYKRTWQIAMIAILCLAGTLFCSLLMVGLKDSELLGTLAFYTEFNTNAELGEAANIFFIACISWFLGFLALQLGVKALPEEKVRKLFGG